MAKSRYRRRLGRRRNRKVFRKGLRTHKKNIAPAMRGGIRL